MPPSGAPAPSAARDARRESQTQRDAAADCFSQGHIVTVEMTNGNAYRGKLLDGELPLHCPFCCCVGEELLTVAASTAEDNMNVQLKDITVTARDGRVSHLEQVYIRGSHVRFFIVPDMLRYARPQSRAASPSAFCLLFLSVFLPCGPARRQAGLY